MNTALERLVAHPLGYHPNLRILEARVTTRRSSSSFDFPYGILWYSAYTYLHFVADFRRADASNFDDGYHSISWMGFSIIACMV